MKRLISFIFIFLLTGIVFAQRVDTSLVVGEFTIEKVTDGDTFRFKGLDKSTRLLGIDTEETYKDKKAREKSSELEKNWPQAYYDQQKASKHKRPVKMDTPFGFEAWMWAKDISSNVSKVRLEKDENARYIDSYGRYLVYVILYKDGKWVNYNIECVKLGYSPYFNKYGNSKRFHKEFVEAQKYAQEHKLGIWNSETKCYPDYPERLKWWNKRAEQIENYEQKYASIDNYFDLMNNGEYERLENYLGKEVTVFGNISEVSDKKTPYLIRIGIRIGLNFDIVLFEENAELLPLLKMDEKKDYYIYAKGKLTEYRGKYQIVLNNVEQLWME